MSIFIFVLFGIGTHGCHEGILVWKKKTKTKNKSKKTKTKTKTKQSKKKAKQNKTKQKENKQTNDQRVLFVLKFNRY